VLRMLGTPLDELRRRAEALAAKIGALPGIERAIAIEDVAYVGGDRCPIRR